MHELLVHEADYSAGDARGNLALHFAAAQVWPSCCAAALHMRVAYTAAFTPQGSLESVSELLAAGRKLTVKAKNKVKQAAPTPSSGSARG